MRSRSLVSAVAFLLAVSATAQYRGALPGYQYQFPRDHFNHPDFQTEWWYYTGNMKSSDGHRFGFELTFFRQGIERLQDPIGIWDVQDLYVAHLALSDLDRRTFLYSERTNRAGPGIAGADDVTAKIWNGNWQVSWHGDQQVLTATDQRFSLRFTMQPAKPVVIHGQNGISQKAEGPGRASHYISLTRLITTGEIQAEGKTLQVVGTAWMDHEFFTHELDAAQAGWDWLSIQLHDNSELMLFRIRRRDGSLDPFSAGTFVDATGRSTHLSKEEFSLQPGNITWTSPTNHAVYPVKWRISIPRLGINLECSTPLPSQELASSSKILPNYWEGAIVVSGSKAGTSSDGVGYLEMTGYDHPIETLRY
jgi:predicted secreted hydrolase